MDPKHLSKQKTVSAGPRKRVNNLVVYKYVFMFLGTYVERTPNLKTLVLS